MMTGSNQGTVRQGSVRSMTIAAAATLNTAIKRINSLCPDAGAAA